MERGKTALKIEFKPMSEPDRLKSGNAPAAANIEVGPMSESDLPEVMEIEKVSFPTPWSKESYLAELESEAACYRVVRLDGKLVGYGGMWLIVDEAHITNIAVHPDFRQQRIGERLMGELISLANQHKAIGITLEVRPSNQGALRLYNKLGFLPTAIRKGYYSDTGEDALIMWKYLVPVKSVSL
jgi:ribosomal-protein-alanine N-acetyltransferase